MKERWISEAWIAVFIARRLWVLCCGVELSLAERAPVAVMYRQASAVEVTHFNPQYRIEYCPAVQVAVVRMCVNQVVGPVRKGEDKYVVSFRHCIGDENMCRG